MKILVDGICKAIDATPGFRRYLERATFLRNDDSHPTHNSYSGGLIKRSSAMDMLNLINILFLDHRIEDESERINNDLGFDFEIFRNSCSAIREGNNTDYYAIYDFELIESYEVHGSYIWLIGYHPILRGMVEGIKNDRHPQPVFESIREIKTCDQGYSMTKMNGEVFDVIKPKNLFYIWVMESSLTNLTALRAIKKLCIKLLFITQEVSL